MMKRNGIFLSETAKYTGLALLLLIAALFGVRYGSAQMSISDFFAALCGKDGFETQTVILYSVRLPRVLAGALAGVGLSVSGVLLQSITDNGLAGPNIIGVNAGAGFAVVLMLSFLPMASVVWLPLAAFAGAFLATLVILAISGGIGASKSSLILSGIALTALLNAGISFCTLLNDDVLSSFNAFSVGGLAGVSVREMSIPLVIITVCVLTALLFSRGIGLLLLGDHSATALGVNVKMLRILCMILASALAGAVVSFAGLLGFVGLVIPHMARRLVGYRIAAQIVCSSFLGAILVIFADLLGRVLAAPSEIPVGIMMAFVGAPFFLWLLWKRRHGGMTGEV